MLEAWRKQDSERETINRLRVFRLSFESNVFFFEMKSVNTKSKHNQWFLPLTDEIVGLLQDSILSH